tara:strand:- start:176 stop:424 length:249 start_codon:yes stop_codon:yes gene_type:complete
MNMIHPIGPKKSTITSQPIFGLNGQRDPAGMRHGPAEGLMATCIIGRTKPKIRTVQASQTGNIFSPRIKNAVRIAIRYTTIY